MRHVLPDPNAEVTVRPYAVAYIVLHTLPDKWLRIDAQLPHVFDIKNSSVFLQVSVNGRLLPFQKTRFHRIEPV